MPQKIISLLKEGVKANISDKYRSGNIIYLPADAELIATGDLHGHQRNFERIVSYTDLANNPNRHLLLQEIIHGGPEDDFGGCLSFKLFFEAVKYKADYPDRVHFIMSNHDTTFITNGQVMKNGKEMNLAMRMAIDREYPENRNEIKEAMKKFFVSQPLAIKCENRIWLSHSLPSDKYIDKFDKTIFSRQLTLEDTVAPGPAYLFTWGRKHSQEALDKMAKMLDVNLFVLGHQRQAEGFSQAGNNLLIIASEHNHGCLLPVKISETYTIDQLKNSIVPLASIA